MWGIRVQSKINLSELSDTKKGQVKQLLKEEEMCFVIDQMM